MPFPARYKTISGRYEGHKYIREIFQQTGKSRIMNFASVNYSFLGNSPASEF